MRIGTNRADIAENVEEYINLFEAKPWVRRLEIRKVCDDLSIFDWWNEYLSKSQLVAMRTFLKTAERLGFNGYVCFKPGVTYCANGMWAYKEESKDGYSPDGECIYHSFLHGLNEWDYCNADGDWLHETRNGDTFTFKEVEAAIKG